MKPIILIFLIFSINNSYTQSKTISHYKNVINHVKTTKLLSKFKEMAHPNCSDMYFSKRIQPICDYEYLLKKSNSFLNLCPEPPKEYDVKKIRRLNKKLNGKKKDA